MKYTLFLNFFIFLTLTACDSVPGVSTLLEGGEIDLIPLPAAGFCRDGAVIVAVRNQGGSDAESSTASVRFSPGGTTEIPTPDVPGGRIATLPPVTMPAECFMPACSVQVNIDIHGDVSESNEENNTADISCPAPG